MPTISMLRRSLRFLLAAALVAAFAAPPPAAAGVQEPTTTALACSPNPSSPGEEVTCTANVSAASGTPTGTVSFQVDGGSSIVVSLAGGQAQFTTSTLTVGPHNVTADYTSDSAAFADSSATPFEQTVQPRPTTTVLGCSPNPSAPGESVTCTATVTASSGTPTGTVTFQIDGGGSIVVALAGGQAQFTTSTLTIGPHTITALYTSDTTVFVDSAAEPFTQTVQPRPTTTALGCSPNPSAPGETVTCTATVSASSGTPTGTVTFQIDGGGSVVVALAAGQAQLTTSTLTVGPHTVTAIYTSDTTGFADSAAEPFIQTVATTLAAIPTVSAWGGLAMMLLLAGLALRSLR